MTREGAILALLERWHELNDPTRSGGGGGRGLVLMPHEEGCRILTSRPPECSCFRGSVGEIERLLRAMRDGDDDVRQARWQVIERYVRCRQVVQTVSRPMVDKHGRVRRNKAGVMRQPVREVVTIYDSRVEATMEGRPREGGLLEDGLVWLAWNWRGPEPRLPGELARRGRAA